MYTRLCFHRYASRYAETKVRCCASFQASLRHPVIFSEGKLSRGAGLLSMHLPRPPLPKASCEARSGSIFAHVSRATTAHQGTSYWIAARTISRARYLLYATVTLPHSFLRFSSIPVADFILRRRRFPTRLYERCGAVFLRSGTDWVLVIDSIDGEKF